MDNTNGIILIIIAASAVVLPLVIGAAMGKIPRSIFVRWAIPLFASTFLLALGIRFVEYLLDPLQKLLISIFFGSIWIFGGMQLFLLRFHVMQTLPEETQKQFRAMGIMFFVFGIVWIAISVTH